MKPWRRTRFECKLGFERDLSPFETFQLVLETGRAQPIGNGVDQTTQTAGGCGEFLALGDTLRMPSLGHPVDLVVERLHELPDQVGMHQVVLEGNEDNILEIFPADAAAVGTRALSAGGGACQIVPADTGKVCAAVATLHLAGQQMFDPAALSELGRPGLGDTGTAGDGLLSDETADIEFVVEDAGATTSVPSDGGIAPGPAHGSGGPVGIQFMGDPPR